MNHFFNFWYYIFSCHLHDTYKNVSLSKFCENESYDIRKYIKNNQTKFDVTVTYPSQFPSWFLQFKYLRGYQLMGWAFLTGGLISLLFFITLISLAYTHLQSSWYIYLFMKKLLILLCVIYCFINSFSCFLLIFICSL